MGLTVSAPTFPSAMASARRGMQRNVERLDDAAGRIARFGLDTSGDEAAAGASSPDAGASPPQAADDSLADAMIDVLTAQRAFAAQLRTLRTAAEMSEEAVNLGQPRDAARTTP